MLYINSPVVNTYIKFMMDLQVHWREKKQVQCTLNLQIQFIPKIVTQVCQLSKSPGDRFQHPSGYNAPGFIS